jgi:hypothetical protein
MLDVHHSGHGVVLSLNPYGATDVSVSMMTMSCTSSAILSSKGSHGNLTAPVHPQCSLPGIKSDGHPEAEDAKTEPSTATTTHALISEFTQSSFPYKHHSRDHYIYNPT